MTTETIKLTRAQSEVLDYMIDFFNENDQIPPVAYISAKFGVRQNSTVGILKILERKGCIERNAVGKFRFSRKVPG